MQGKVRMAAKVILLMGGVSLAGLNAITEHEGIVYEAYPDPAHGWGVPTICVGSTRGVQRGMRAYPEDCQPTGGHSGRGQGRGTPD